MIPGPPYLPSRPRRIEVCLWTIGEAEEMLLFQRIADIVHDPANGFGDAHVGAGPWAPEVGDV